MNKRESDIYITLFILIVGALLLFFSQQKSEKIEKLESQYESLEEEHYALLDEYSTAIGHCEDPIMILYRFFEDEEDVSFDEAYDAMMTIRSELNQFY